MAKKSLEIDMCAGSQLRDSQGEMLSIEGADISELTKINDNHGKGFFNSLGIVTESKKIFGPEDCDNERHKYYWEKVKSPYIYVRGFLHDNEDHPNAKAAAAILRNIHKSDCPLKLKASVEGGVLARGLRDPSLLAQTKIHSIAVTFSPANHATLVEPLNLDKSSVDEEHDRILIKSVMHLAQKDVPSFRMIEKAASAVKAARNIKQIHLLLKQAKQEEMEKGVRGALAGAVTAARLIAAPMSTADQHVDQPKVTQQAPKQQAVNVPSFVDKIKGSNPHLWAIAQQESSGGKNMNHETMQSGQHKGHTAGGPWGMMPKTVAYILKMSKGLSGKYPKLAQSAKDLDTNHHSITEQLNKDPKAAYDLAKTLYSHIKKVHGNDANKIFHSWHYGIQGTGAAQNAGKDVANDEYVKKITSHLNALHPTRSAASVASMEKALTAGYGGGTPTNSTGGMVFQTESIEDGRPNKFKYVTCDHCGKEQIFSKHQVKCRSCHHSFGLNKLVKLMS